MSISIYLSIYDQPDGFWLTFRFVIWDWRRIRTVRRTDRAPGPTGRQNASRRRGGTAER